MTGRRMIKLGEHVFIAGKTGTGKTYLARKYLAGYPRVYVLDTKGLIKWEEVGRREVKVIKRLSELTIAARRYEKIIYRPNFQEMENEYYNEFFKFCYMRKRCAVWVDEVMSVGTVTKFPEYYKAILTRGREHLVSAWSLTQRPTSIPVLSMSEATHFFVFDLNMPQDREKLAEVSGMPLLRERPTRSGFGKYSFWYYHVEADQAVAGILKEKS